MKFKTAWDTGSKYADRYAVLFDTDDVFFLSHDADMPNGVCMHMTLNDLMSLDKYPTVNLTALPKGTQRQIEILEDLYNQPKQGGTTHGYENYARTYSKAEGESEKKSTRCNELAI